MGSFDSGFVTHQCLQPRHHPASWTRDHPERTQCPSPHDLRLVPVSPSLRRVRPVRPRSTSVLLVGVRRDGARSVFARCRATISAVRGGKGSSRPAPSAIPRATSRRHPARPTYRRGGCRPRRRTPHQRRGPSYRRVAGGARVRARPRDLPRDAGLAGRQRGHTAPRSESHPSLPLLRCGHDLALPSRPIEASDPQNPSRPRRTKVIAPRSIAEPGGGLTRYSPFLCVVRPTLTIPGLD